MDLIRPIQSGDKLLSSDMPATDNDNATHALAVVLLTACAAVVACVVTVVGG